MDGLLFHRNKILFDLTFGMLRVGLAQTASILNICVCVTVLFTSVGIDCCRLVTSGLQAYTQQYNEYTQAPSSTKQKKICTVLFFHQSKSLPTMSTAASLVSKYHQVSLQVPQRPDTMITMIRRCVASDIKDEC